VQQLLLAELQDPASGLVTSASGVNKGLVVVGTRVVEETKEAKGSGEKQSEKQQEKQQEKQREQLQEQQAVDVLQWVQSLATKIEPTQLAGHRREGGADILVIESDDDSSSLGTTGTGRGQESKESKGGGSGGGGGGGGAPPEGVRKKNLATSPPMLSRGGVAPLSLRAEAKEEKEEASGNDASKEAAVSTAGPPPGSTIGRTPTKASSNGNSFASYFDLVKKVEDEAAQERAIAREQLFGSAVGRYPAAGTVLHYTLYPTHCTNGPRTAVRYTLYTIHCTHYTVLLLYSYCTPTVLLLYSYCTPTVLLLHSYCTPTVLLLQWCALSAQICVCSWYTSRGARGRRRCRR
jgi:hypothetical protein